MDNYYSVQTNFYGNSTPTELVREFGSPLYVYNEKILRERCRELKQLVSYPKFKPNYSVKANSNLHLLKIALEEGMNADAMSPGEIYVLLEAGFKKENILYISNNVSAEEMRFAIDNDILVSIDSLSQLELFGRINRGGKLSIRFNAGVGAGHHDKVVTAGKKTKFGINIEKKEEVKEILNKYDLKLVGINQHIGSLFMDGSKYVESVHYLLNLAKEFKDLEFIDMGGGFGIPYNKQTGEARLDLKALGQQLDKVLFDFGREYGRELTFKIEPGRYVVAECGAIIGTVHAVKENYATTFVGTDVGFNVLARPVMYDSHHDIEVYSDTPAIETKEVTVVGNICESGDILAKDRVLPLVKEGDLVGIMDAGAYGFSMSSNYNNRLKPAEVLIKEDGTPRLIRRRDTFEDLMRNF
jgi:diaminopimelate decarboxylase